MKKVELAIANAGGISALAKRLGVKAPTIHQWRNGARRVPPSRVLAIEALTGVSRYELRPDVFGEPPSEGGGV